MSRKRNFMTKRKKNYSGQFQTMFNIGVSSRALFNLSPNGLKLYMFFVLNGKTNEPNIGRFAKMMKVSPRSVSRYYEELKEKNFLKITPIGINRYKYEFDPWGDVNKVFKKPKKDMPIKDNIKFVEKEKEKADVVEDQKPIPIIEKINEFVEKSKEIKEYEDFAILENQYWLLEKENQKKIVKILEERLLAEPMSKEPIEWFLNKVK